MKQVKHSRINTFSLATASLCFAIPLCLTGFFFAWALVPSFREVKVRFDPDEFKIKGIYGVTIPYAEMERVDTVHHIPAISLRTNGYALGKTLIGNFKFFDDRRSKLFIKKGFAPYVLIEAKEMVPVYINFENEQKTIDLYNELKNKR